MAIYSDFEQWVGLAIWC